MNRNFRGCSVFYGVTDTLLRNAIQVYCLGSIIKINIAKYFKGTFYIEELFSILLETFQCSLKTFFIKFNRYKSAGQRSCLFICLFNKRVDFFGFFRQFVILISKLLRQVLGNQAYSREHLSQSVMQILANALTLVLAYP